MAETVIRIIIRVVCFYTGEIILYIGTVGWKKPRWDYYSNESPVKWLLLIETSFWIGFFFWVFAIGFIARQLME